LVRNMGQYFVLVNLDKREYLHPHKLGMGLKLYEICANKGAGVLPYLLRKSSGNGGGDVNLRTEWAGHWAGDRIVVIGDYDESGLYQKVQEPTLLNEEIEYKDISLEVREEYEKFLGEPLGERWDKKRK
jgi:hypothetical protein